jgi:hypothetical protein
MTGSNKQSTWNVDFRTFSILLLLAAIPLLLGAWWLFASHEESELELTGTYLSNMSETAFSSINNFLQNQIIGVAAVTEVSTLRDAVSSGNLDLRKNLAEVRQSIPKMETVWRSSDSTAPMVKAILDHPGSQFLRRHQQLEKYHRDIIVTDFLGRLVAATSKSPMYYWAHEEWWKETYGDGFRGAVYLGDVRRDEVYKSYVMDIAHPFVEPEGGVIGTIRVVMDLQGIDSLIGSMQSASGPTVALIHAKGDPISAPGYSTLHQALYPATLDILNARDRSKNWFLSTDPPGSIFGLSQRSFPEVYPHLNWIVVSRQDAESILVPLRRLRAYFLALIVAVFLAALVAALMLSRVESKPIIETDPHLEKL